MTVITLTRSVKSSYSKNTIISNKIYKNISLEIKSKNDKCSICRLEYNDDDNVRILECEHIFHTECVDTWLLEHSYKCPYCRNDKANHIPKI